MKSENRSTHSSPVLDLADARHCLQSSHKAANRLALPHVALQAYLQG